MADSTAHNADYLKSEWLKTTNNVLSEAGLEVRANTKMVFGGKDGRHTDHLATLLDEMQYMQRTYPDMEW